MAKRKAAKKTQSAGGQTTNNGVEPMVVKLAGQLGTLLGRVQSKALRLGRSSSSKKTPRSGQADGWIESAAVRKQVGQIRDGATQLMNRVNQAGATVRMSVTKSMTAKKSKAKPMRAAKGRSGGLVDAPGKRHRKPPPQELFDARLGEPIGKQMGQKRA